MALGLLVNRSTVLQTYSVFILSFVGWPSVQLASILEMLALKNLKFLMGFLVLAGTYLWSLRGAFVEPSWSLRGACAACAAYDARGARAACAARGAVLPAARAARGARAARRPWCPWCPWCP